MTKIISGGLLVLLAFSYGDCSARRPATDGNKEAVQARKANPSSNDIKSDQTQSPAKLTGGFIQVGDAEKKLPVGKWADLLGELKTNAGVDTIMVQSAFFQDKDESKHHYIVLAQGTLDPNNPKYDPKMVLAANDPTNAILTFADTHGQTVYLGLWMQDLPFGTMAGSLKDVEDYFRIATQRSTAAADVIWNLYHQHPSFGGWYIAHELWNFPFGDQSEETLKKQGAVKSFIKTVGDKCRELNNRKEADGKSKDRKLAISAYFNPWFDPPTAGPKVVRQVFESILKGSDLDVLIIQDSVGAKCLGNEKLDDEGKEAGREQIKRKMLPEYLKAYYGAAKAAANQAHPVKLWNDLEVFEVVSGRCPTPQQFQTPDATLPFRPTNIDRLKWQFNVALRDPETGQPYLDPDTNQPVQLFEKFIVFDFFHYMNTVIPEGFGTDVANTQSQRAKLFNDYRREIMNGPSPAPTRNRGTKKRA